MIKRWCLSLPPYHFLLVVMEGSVLSCQQLKQNSPSIWNISASALLQLEHLLLLISSPAIIIWTRMLNYIKELYKNIVVVLAYKSELNDDKDAETPLLYLFCCHIWHFGEPVMIIMIWQLLELICLPISYTLLNCGTWSTIFCDMDIFGDRRYASKKISVAEWTKIEKNKENEISCPLIAQKFWFEYHESICNVNLFKQNVRCVDLRYLFVTLY